MNLKKFISVLLCFSLIIVSTGIAPVYAVEEKENYTKILYDFEYVTGEENKDAPNYVSTFNLPTYSATWLTENANGGYSTRKELAAALYEQDIPLYMWTNAGAEDHNNTATTATVVSSADGAPVRFGDKSLRIDFDYSHYNYQKNVNFYLRTTAPIYKFEGDPTAIGVWVYAPEGTTAYNLYLQCAGKVDLVEGTSVNSYQCLTTPEAMGNDSKGISWTGWRYLEFDLTGTNRFTGSANVGYRPYGQNTDNGVFWISYLPSIMGTNVISDTIYIDNITLIYGDRDKQEPVISALKVNDVEIVDKKTIVFSKNIKFTAEYTDLISDNENFVTGIDKADLYVDGILVNSDAEITDSDLTYKTVLSEGIHTVKLNVYDIYSNMATTERMFTVVVNLPEEPETKPDEPTTEPDNNSGADEEDSSEQTEIMNNITEFFNKIKDFIAKIADFFKAFMNR